jgi:hypothetical protein
LAEICLVVDYLTKKTFTYHYAILISNYLNIFSNLEFQKPQIKKSQLSHSPYPKIEGAYISASAHAIVSIFTSYHPSLNGGWYKLKSKVIALLEAKK